MLLTKKIMFLLALSNVVCLCFTHSEKTMALVHDQEITQ
ncbi:hypothetical protein ABWED_1680 [Acinetobacter lwoffii]|nr:hypothetical protein ABWED_1680 [Acinetobacter lwoffii]